MKKVGALSELVAKSLPGQMRLPEAEEFEDGRNKAAYQQVTVSVDRASLAVLKEFADREGIKRNRLINEAIQLYAVMLNSNKRCK